jgi:3-phosphoshikimate 1-carboxyvinyltransferase
VIIRPAKSIQGEITLPGDKSISHRAAIIASLAEGESRIENYSNGEDCASTLLCLRQLGVSIEQSGKTVVVHGVGKTGFKPPTEPLDCGNSGTTMRLLAGVLAAQNFDCALTGDESLCNRPMERIVEPLRQMGAIIRSTDSHPPLTIRPADPLKAIRYRVPIASAQVKSCLLIAGLNADGETIVCEDVVTRDHTERMLCGFGVDVQISEAPEGRCIAVRNDSELFGRKLRVPADISAAAYFLIAAACIAGSDLTITHLGLNPTRTAILGVLRSCGVEVQIRGQNESLGEPIGDVSMRNTIRQGDVDTLLIEGRQAAELIDELPILAVMGTQLSGGILVHGARELRTKETDRIAATAKNLRRMNADVQEFDDGFRVGRSNLKGAEIEPFGDHRIAMSFAVAGLLAEGETFIRDPECVRISFPGFFETLESVVKRLG